MTKISAISIISVIFSAISVIFSVIFSAISVNFSAISAISLISVIFVTPGPVTAVGAHYEPWRPAPQRWPFQGPAGAVKPVDCHSVSLVLQNPYF